MSSAASRLAAALGGMILRPSLWLPAAACAVACSLSAAAAESSSAAPVRSAPTRPGAAVNPPPAPTGIAPASSSSAAKAKAPLSTSATRAAEVRSGPAPVLATTRIKNDDYISALEIAAKLGFKGKWDEAKRELSLAAGPRSLVLTGDKREVSCDGRRIFLGDAVLFRAGKLYVTRTDYERCLLALLRPDLVTVAPPKLRTIVLDPGHGGNDPGMENQPLRLQEKVLVLDVALRLEKLLKAEGYNVILTRRDDRALGPTKEADLQRRALIANAASADLFLSIHFNSLYPDTRVGGTEVYVFTRPGQRSDQSWGFGQADDTEDALAPVNRYDAWSALLAHAVHRETIAALKTSDRGHKTKHLAVLRGLTCPAVLVESVFLSNATEARRAATTAYRQQIADAMFAGIRSYAATIAALPAKSSAPTATAPRPAPSNSP